MLQSLMCCSPHLLSLRERISINGQPIACRDFDELVSSGLEAAGASLGGVSHFEVMTALALRQFQQQKVGCCTSHPLVLARWHAPAFAIGCSRGRGG